MLEHGPETATTEERGQTNAEKYKNPRTPKSLQKKKGPTPEKKMFSISETDGAIKPRNRTQDGAIGKNWAADNTKKKQSGEEQILKKWAARSGEGREKKGDWGAFLGNGRSAPSFKKKPTYPRRKSGSKENHKTIGEAVGGLAKNAYGN